MIAALFYLQAYSAWNRLRARLKRLKQPKYLVGAIVGGAYVYFYFFRFLFLSRHGVAQGAPASPLAAEAGLGADLGALALFVVVLLAWIFPRERAALAFTEAEVAFLFPAPISRRGLIHYKLARSQFAILFTTVLLALFTGRWRAGLHAWISLAGWWVILATLNLHFLAASFARSRLLDRGISTWQRRVIVLGALALAVIATVLWGRRTLPSPQLEDLADLGNLAQFARQWLGTGPMLWLLYPFHLVIQPSQAKGAVEFLAALGPALLILALHYVWVIRADVNFEEASVEFSQKLAQRLAAARASRTGAPRPQKPRRDPFPLRASGPAPVAFLWKNLIAAGQWFTARMALVLLVSLGMPVVLVALNSTRSAGWFVVGAVSLGLLAMSFITGPQMLRHDFRQDLPAADILKLYPLPGWQLVLGELLAPVVILTVAQGALILLAVTLFDPPGHAVPRPTRLVCGLGAALVAPAINCLAVLIPNAAALLFPGWMATGREAAPRGIEAMGQGLILLLGQVCVLLLAVLPASLLAAAILFAGHWLGSWRGAVPVASLAAALVVLAEAGLGVWLLGKVFDRLDVAAEINS